MNAAPPIGSPFHPWLHLYGTGVFSRAPWWREVDRTTDGPIFERIDGVRVRRDGPDVLSMWSVGAHHTENHGPTSPGKVMKLLDRTNPVPRPQPHAGQVWVREDGRSRMLTESPTEAHPVGLQRWYEDSRSVLVFGPGAPWAPTEDPNPWWIPDGDFPPPAQATPAAPADPMDALAVVERFRHEPHALWKLVRTLGAMRVVGPWTERTGHWVRHAMDGSVLARLEPVKHEGVVNWAPAGEPLIKYDSLPRAKTAVDDRLLLDNYLLTPEIAVAPTPETP